MHEYLELRRRARENNESMREQSPCQRGGADCCQGEIFVSGDDLAMISGAAGRNLISLEVLSDAYRNALNPKRKACPFLQPNNDCGIYPYRPLICIDFGYGGYEPDQGKYGEEMIIKGGNLALCEQCKVKVGSQVTCPQEVVRVSTLVGVYYNNLNQCLSLKEAVGVLLNPSDKP